MVKRHNVNSAKVKMVRVCGTEEVLIKAIKIRYFENVYSALRLTQ